MAKLFENLFSDKRIGCAVELHTTGWCNLNCKYCYIPKHDNWKNIHKKIKENIENGMLIEQLMNNFGEDLEYLSHWGTEPTLTLSSFKKFYEQAFELFPRLKQIGFSSNFMTNIHNLNDWIMNLPQTRRVNLQIQCSLDGPAWVNDENRQIGSAHAVSQNLIKFVKYMNENSDKIIHNVELVFKPTVGANFFPELAEYDRLVEYYTFFEEVIGSLFKENVNNKVQIQRYTNPTIVFPYSFTKQDGEFFNKIIENTERIEQEKIFKNIIICNNYYGYMDKFKYIHEFYAKRWMFSCSAGDSCFALDHKGLIRPCHRLYFMEYDEYVESTKSNCDGRDVTDQHALESKTFYDVKNNLIVDSTDEKKILKFLDLQRSYHDYGKFLVNNIVTAILELANAGQISEIYKNHKMADILAHFIALFECPVEKQLQFGSTFLPDFGIIRLFGNGVFEKMCRQYIQRNK